MSTLQQYDGRVFYQNWWKIMSSLFHCQWRLCSSQYQISLKLLEGALRRPTPGRTSPTPGILDECRTLESEAAERVGQGLAPPKKIYKAPYRDQIDWSKFPQWAKPTDPEVFQGCSHEG